MVEPTGYSALDLIGFTDRGPYAANVNYVKNDLVHHGGNIWRVLIDDTMGITPTEGMNYTVFIGEPTNLVERIIAPLETNPATIGYTTGRQIIYNDYLYEVITDIAIGDSLITYETDPTNANIKLAPPVETQLLAVRAEADATDNMIAPTEASASSSSAPYSVGDQLILNNILYDVIAAIQIGDALTTGTGGNIAAADTLTDQLKTIDSSIETLTNNDDAMLNVLGAKNLLPNNATSQTINGVTFTVNSDGSVTASGTATSNASLVISYANYKKGKYIVTKFADDAWYNSTSGEYNYMALIYHADFGTAFITNEDTEVEFNSDFSGIQFALRVASGVTINKTIYPMIRPASVADDTYVPYAMTNRELTEEALDYEVISSVTSGTVHYVVSFVCGYRHGNHYHVEVIGEYDGQVSNATTVPFFKISGIPTISANRRVGTVIINDDTIAPACATIHTDGYIYQTMKSSVSSGNVSFILDFYIK